jgi:2',3'-cyclic-nucleotide 2'-phosphodiesterase (5'-nucleotidase family)
MEQLKKLVSKSNAAYVSSNFIDLSNGKTVSDAYKIITYGSVKVAYVGISTPETFTSSTPAYFQNEKGEYIYDFCQDKTGEKLYTAVQNAVNSARSEGADYVIAVSHLGINQENTPWRSIDIIENTFGINAVIDGHSHSTIACDKVKDKEGKEVILTSTGSQLKAVGKLVITDKGITSELVSDYTKKDVDVAAYVTDIENKYSELLNKVVAKTDVDLIATDKTGKRVIRTSETNLGDLCADAYRKVSGADIAFVNGGGIRADIKKGDITYKDIISVHPFGNMLCVVDATGQEIIDALEMASRKTPEENGGFLQVSGLTYEIHHYIPSSVVVDDKGMFVKVNGEYRVKNVRVLDSKTNSYCPLKLDMTYTLASHNYMLKNGGDGINMFTDNKILQDEVMIDNQVLINYIVDDLGGVIGEKYIDLHGSMRIFIFNEKHYVLSDVLPDRIEAGDSATTGTAVITIILCVGVVFASSRRKRRG